MQVFQITQGGAVFRKAAREFCQAKPEEDNAIFSTALISLEQAQHTLYFNSRNNVGRVCDVSVGLCNAKTAIEKGVPSGGLILSRAFRLNRSLIVPLI